MLADQQTSDQEKIDSLSLLIPQLSTQESKIAALQDGAVEALSSLLPCGNSALVSAACVALGSLSTQLQVRWVWSSASVLQRMCPLLSDSTESVAAAAAHALCSFVSFADGAGAVFESQEGLEHLIASIPKSQWSVLPLAAFLPHYAELTEKAVQLGAVEACVAWVSPQSHEDVLLQACRAFRSVAAGAAGKQRCLDAGVVGAMLLLLGEAVSPAVTGAAMCTLCLLAATEKSFLDMVEAKLSPGLVSSIVDSASSTDNTLQLNSILCIQLLSALGSLKQGFALYMAAQSSTALFLRVFGTSAFSQILQVLGTGDSAAGRQQASLTCSAAAAVDGGGEALAQTLNSLATLLVGCAQHLAAPVAFTAPPRAELNMLVAASCINQLCQSDSVRQLNPAADSSDGAHAAALACVDAIAAAASASSSARQGCIQVLSKASAESTQAAAFVQQVLAVPCMEKLGLEV